MKYLKLVVKLEFLCEIPNHMLPFEVGCSYKKNHILQKQSIRSYEDLNAVAVSPESAATIQLSEKV